VRRNASCKSKSGLKESGTVDIARGICRWRGGFR
jgi:hypothetical protein